MSGLDTLVREVQQVHKYRAEWGGCHSKKCRLHFEEGNDLATEQALHEAHVRTALIAAFGDWLGSEEVREAVGRVESVHQFHGDDCLCGFSSARSRSRTEHITRAALAALGELLGGGA